MQLILAGGTALSQTETLIRPDKAVQRSFGRSQCVHSALIQDMLDACSADTVGQLQKLNAQLYNHHGQAPHHDFSQGLLILDLDLTGLLASKRAEGSTKGYFAKKPGARGRQLCRVMATAYEEIICQALLPGDTTSEATLKPAIKQAQQILRLSKPQRQNTLLRWDAGFGTDENINWMLSQDYQILGKVYSHTRVSKLLKSATNWVSTPSSPGREVARVYSPHRYVRRTHQFVVRTPKKDKKTPWAYAALVTSLLELDPFEAVDLYDDRGGGIETGFRSDRQGLGLSKRRKHRMAAQQMLTHLAERAHNLLIWTARQLGPPVNQYGILRLIRDALQIQGYVLFSEDQPIQIGLNFWHPLAPALCEGFNRLFKGPPRVKLWIPIENVKDP
jgi:hypothetical protein